MTVDAGCSATTCSLRIARRRYEGLGEHFSSMLSSTMDRVVRMNDRLFCALLPWLLQVEVLSIRSLGVVLSLYCGYFV